MGRPKREREGLGLGLKRPPLAEPMQQPTKNGTSNGADIWDEIRPWRNVGKGTITRRFRWLFERQKIKCKNTLRGSTRPPEDKETHNNQPKDSVGDGGKHYNEMGPRRNLWGDGFMAFGVANMRQKIKKINQIVVLGGRRMTILHNNQPKTCMPNGGGIIKDAQPEGDVRGARSHRFRGNQVGRRLKNEIK